jgi:hypothetical protein
VRPVNHYEVPIIMYHSINDADKNFPLSSLSLPTEEFTNHLRYYRDAGFEFVFLSDLLKRGLEGRLGNEKLIVLTFDDGFLDNSLLASRILRQFDAKGTIFVNPAYAYQGPLRSIKEDTDAWGILNFEEMREIEKIGVFDIQSHTMSHEDIFLSDRLIDFYTPDKFNQYYWLLWKLNPSVMNDWYGDVSRFSSLIPSGYPIFEYGRALRGKEFNPSDEFVNRSVHLYRIEGMQCLDELQSYRVKGIYEPEKRYRQRVEEQLVQSKFLLEQELSKTIDCICFPGEIYSEFVLSRAQVAGYKLYLRSHWEKRRSNLVEIRSARRILDDHQMIGLQRLVVPRISRTNIAKKAFTYWMAKIAVEAYQGNNLYNSYLSSARFIKRRILKKVSISRLNRNEY